MFFRHKGTELNGEWSLEKNPDGTYDLLCYCKEDDGFASAGITKLTDNNIRDMVSFIKESLYED